MKTDDSIDQASGAPRALLVEDSPGDAMLIRKKLEMSDGQRSLDDLELVHAETLTEALALLEQGPSFEVILLDLGLPESRGLDTLERIREVSGTTSIVVLTGLGCAEAASSAVLQGADDYLEKDGLTSDALRRAIRYAIDRGKRARELRIKTDAMDFAEMAMLLVDDPPGGERDVYVNRAFEELTGFSAEQMESRGIEDLLDFEHIDGEVDDVEAALSGSSKVRFESILETPDEERFWVSVGIIPIARGEGANSQTLFTLEDVSARHEMLTRLGEIDRMITLGTLSASVAHEINNPLSFIGGNVQYALKRLEKVYQNDQDVPEEIQDVLDALGDAMEGSERVRAVVEDLRDLAGGGVPDADAMTERVDVHSTVLTSAGMIRKQVESRAEFHIDVGEDFPQVIGSSSKLGQVVLNLALNAAQAIPPDVDDGRVDVRGYAFDETVVIEVEDNGEGVAPEMLHTIFEPFFSTKSSQEGTGLGLAICNQTVTRMGGEIEVESQPGEGALFRVKLPTVDRRLREWSEISDASEAQLE